MSFRKPELVTLAAPYEVEGIVERRLRRWTVQGHTALAENLLHSRNQPCVIELLEVVLALP